MQYKVWTNVYDEQGRWVGFFVDIKAAKDWVKRGKHKGYAIEEGPKRDVPAVPAPAPSGKFKKPRKASASRTGSTSTKKKKDGTTKEAVSTRATPKVGSRPKSKPVVDESEFDMAKLNKEATKMADEAVKNFGKKTK